MSQGRCPQCGAPVELGWNRRGDRLFLEPGSSADGNLRLVRYERGAVPIVRFAPAGRERRGKLWHLHLCHRPPDAKPPPG